MVQAAGSTKSGLARETSSTTACDLVTNLSCYTVTPQHLPLLLRMVLTFGNETLPSALRAAWWYSDCSINVFRSLLPQLTTGA